MEPVDETVYTSLTYNQEGDLYLEDSLQPDVLQGALESSIFSRNIVFFESLDSTNRMGKELAAQGAPEGSLILAEEQTAGRGRRGRTWLSPGRENLLFSLVLRPPIPAEQAFIPTMILALAAGDGVEEVSGVRPLIKWPNDLYVGNRKLAGILTEFSLWEGLVEFMVIGIGINVNWNPDESGDLIYPATSIFRETKRRTPRTDLMVSILNRLDAFYGRMLSGYIDEFYRRWNELSMILGRDVTVESELGTLRGVALKIDREGALILRDSRGEQRVIRNGDVSLKFA